MKAFYNSGEPMSCLEALWYSAGAEEGELVEVKSFGGFIYIECDNNNHINVYESPEDKIPLASFNANASIEFLSDTIEHMVYKLNK